MISKIALFTEEEKTWIIENFEMNLRLQAMQEVRIAQPATVEELTCRNQKECQPHERSRQSLYISQWSLFRVTAKPTQKSLNE